MNRTSYLVLLFMLSFCMHIFGGEIIDTVKINGIDRSYIYYAPDNLPPDAPLVIVLHGYGGRAQSKRYGMNPVADKNGFAVCYPQGIKDGTGKTGWNVGYPPQHDMESDDVDFVCQLSRHLQQKYNLSVKNTFATGMSNGGDLCYLLAFKAPEYFAAVAPIAGLTMKWYYSIDDSSKPAIPLFEVHGTQDRVSEWEGDLENKGGWGEYLPVPIAVNYWVAKNKCMRAQRDTVASIDAERKQQVVRHKYTEGINGNQVWLYEIIDGAHEWGNRDIHTAEEIWNFFSLFVK